MTIQAHTKIHDGLSVIFTESAPYASITEKPKPFSVELKEKGTVVIRVGSGENAREISGHIASWLPLSSRYWGLVLNLPEGKGAFPSFSFDRLERGGTDSIIQNLRIADALFDISRALLELDQTSAAEKCACAATIQYEYNGKDFDEMLEFIPEPLQKTFLKLTKNIYDIRAELWGGRSSMSKVMSFKTSAPLLKKCQNHPYYLQWLLSFQSSAFTSFVGSSTVKTGKTIDALIQESTVPFAQNAVGMVQHRALEVLEHWVVDIYTRYTHYSTEKNRDTLFFYERSLEYLALLVKEGASPQGLFLFEWEAHLALGNKNKADDLWQTYSEHMPTKMPWLRGWRNPFYLLESKEDKIEYKAFSMAYVSKCIAKERKTSDEQKKYCLELAEEAIKILGDRLNKDETRYEVVTEALNAARKLNGL
jgi:hypothetical protein